MRTEQTDQAAIEVAERIVDAALYGPETNAERIAEGLNIERWAGTPCAGAHFNPLDLAEVVKRGRWLAETERGHRLLNEAAQRRDLAREAAR